MILDMDVFVCKHFNRTHRAKFMCQSCYQRFGNPKKATKCEHTDKSHYSAGLCKNCYLKDFKRKRADKKKSCRMGMAATNQC